MAPFLTHIVVTKETIIIFGRPFVKWFTLCYQILVCLSCPVCDVDVLWPNGWMDQGETWHAGPGHIVLDGDPAALLKTGAEHPPPIFGPCLLWPNG